MRPRPNFKNAPNLSGVRPAPNFKNAPNLSGVRPAPNLSTVQPRPTLTGLPNLSGVRPAPKLSTVRPRPNLSGLPNLSGVHPAPNLSGVQPAPGLGTPGTGGYSSGDHAKTPSARKSGGHKKSGDHKKTDSKKVKKLTKAQKAKKKRMAMFRNAAVGRREEGEPFEGHLAFGVGEGGRGLKHVAIMYGITFVILNLLVTLFEYGQREFEVVSSEPMIYARSFVLVVMGLAGIIGLRRESLKRIGLGPEIVPTVASLFVALLIGAMAMPVARLNVAADANLGMVVGLLALRSLGEAVFFHGFVTRTLLIEMKDSSVAMFISALLYGFYALTFSVIASGSPANIIFGIMVYGFGVGMPMAMVYWKTRSVLIPIIAQLIIFTATAIAGMQYAAQFATS